MAAYSQDLRDRVLNALERGDRPTDIAARFEVSRVWVYEVKNRLQKEGKRTPLPVGGYRRSRVAHLEPTLRSWLKEQADLTLVEMCERLAKQGVQIKSPALWHQLNKWGLSFKKTLHASEQEREDVQQARLEWREDQPRMDANRLAFLDETWAATSMTRTRATRGALRRIGSTRTLEEHHFYRRLTTQHHHGADGGRWPDGRRAICGLCA